MSVSMPLSPKLERRLETIAARAGRSKAAQLQALLEGAIDEVEDRYAAVDVRNRVHTGDGSVSDLDSLERELGLAS